MDKRTEVAKTMIDADTKMRCELLAELRGVPVSVVYCEAIRAHVAKRDARRADSTVPTVVQRERSALSHGDGTSVRSIAGRRVFSAS